MSAKLTVTGLTQVDTAYFSNSIRLVCLFKIIAQEILFFHGLGAVSWINAGATQKKEFFYTVQIGRMYYICLYHQIIVNKIIGVDVISKNTPDLCCCKKNILWLFSLKEILNSLLISQVKLTMCSGNNSGMPL